MDRREVLCDNFGFQKCRQLGIFSFFEFFAEDFPPNRHVPFPVTTDSASAIDRGHHIVHGIYAVVVFGELSEVGRLYFKERSDGACALTILAMTRAAILPNESGLVKPKKQSIHSLMDLR